MCADRVAANDDRTIHARTAGGHEIVRYDRRGHWYEESSVGRLRITIGRAVQLALLPGSVVNPGLPGGGSFDRKVRRSRGF